MVSLNTIKAIEKLIRGLRYIKMPIVAELILFNAKRFKKSGNTVNKAAIDMMMA